MDAIEGANGNRVGGTFWTILLREQPGISAFQIHQHSREELTIHYVADSSLPGTSENYFREAIQRNLGDAMDVTFRLTDRIATTDSGKKRLVVSSVDHVTQLRDE